MRDARLNGANLSGANLCRAEMPGAQLEGATFADEEDGPAVFDEKTVWPRGFDPASAGAVTRGH